MAGKDCCLIGPGQLIPVVCVLSDQLTLDVRRVLGLVGLAVQGVEHSAWH
jgi:hypothetical protein